MFYNPFFLPFSTTDSTSGTNGEVQSTYALLVDLDDNTIVTQRNARDRINPASMTKIMTVLVAAEHVTDLEDTFTITILDRVLTYQVDEIAIVLPSETDKLQIEEGKDYCTLMTCTPYGINTHRLLVRGHRVETVKEKNIHVTAEAFQIEPVITAPVLAAPMLLILLFWLLFHGRKKKK